MRDRLIELLDTSFIESDDNFGVPNAYQVADHLLANGVIVPPCKVVDTVYFVHELCDAEGKEYKDVLEGKVHSLSVDEKRTWLYMSYLCGLNYWHTFDDIGKTVFLTREDAERALKERVCND